MLHDEGSLPIVDAALLHDKTEELAAWTKLRHDIIVVIVHVALVVLQNIRVVYGLQHSNLIGEIRLTGDVALLDDLESSILI